MNLNFSDNWINTTSSTILFLAIFFSQKSVNSQIIPDQTLGKENSVINSIYQLKEQIEGGVIRGANLFHSFQEFNVGEGRSVYFTNPTGIENILLPSRQKITYLIIIKTTLF
ncbi:MAG: filamentous hemagglutinin N-terminal domain-containing protein [Okeania sp. SIO2C2]|uniref:two-partner secretion domain-containing protein n=1 Tax=Okeania sp. SIO2C2 TaxID=2607787 RepID=UPI0013B9B38A|nr:hypothetical protein [Okeania sp. SIO2C2]NEP87222.1 filamentous hemagglutinin N-terminal domain-containing protein [Okeania sp. SIO2C2]